MSGVDVQSVRGVRGVLGAVLLLHAMHAMHGVHAAHAQDRPFGTLREQAALQQSWLQHRLDSILPGLMRRHDVQTWLVICREYNEDPAFFSIIAPTTFACRRRDSYQNRCADGKP